jgi:hypothetical protein
MFATSKVGSAARIAPNAPADNDIGNNKEQHGQQYYEAASKTHADIGTQRDRLLSHWRGGGYTDSDLRRRYVPKYGRRYSDSFRQSLDEATNTQDNNDDDNSEEEDVPCISLANMKYRKHKKSNSEDKLHRDMKSKSGKGHEIYDGAHGSKSKARKSKSKSHDYMDYCEDDGPLQEIQCTANLVDFDSAVTLVFDGNPQFLTGPEQLALEDSFRDTYNGNKLHIVGYSHCWWLEQKLVDLTLAMPTSS